MYIYYIHIPLQGFDLLHDTSLSSHCIIAPWLNIMLWPEGHYYIQFLQKTWPLPLAHFCRSNNSALSMQAAVTVQEAVTSSQVFKPELVELVPVLSSTSTRLIKHSQSLQQGPAVRDFKLELSEHYFGTSACSFVSWFWDSGGLLFTGNLKFKCFKLIAQVLYWLHLHDIPYQHMLPRFWFWILFSLVCDSPHNICIFNFLMNVKFSSKHQRVTGTNVLLTQITAGCIYLLVVIPLSVFLLVPVLLALHLKIRCW